MAEDAVTAQKKPAAPPLSLRGVAGSLRRPTARDLLLSLKAFGAALLALAVAFAAGLQNPYWAALTVYVVTIPSDTGAIRSKALFRLGGTLVGGVLALGLAALFVDRTGFLLFVYLAVVSFLIWLQLIDRTPLGYAWFSIGVTVAVIGLATLQQPLDLFDEAAARTVESAVGIAALLLVDSVFWPQPMTPAFLETMRDWREKARRWIAAALVDDARQQGEEPLRRTLAEQLHALTQGLAAIDGTAAQLPFDTVPTPPRGSDLDVLRRVLVDLIVDLAAIETWSRALRHGGDASAEIHGLTADVARWTAGAVQDEDPAGAALRRRCERHHAALVGTRDRQRLVERALAARLADLVTHWADLATVLVAVERPGRLPLRLALPRRERRPLRSIDGWVKALDVLPLPLATGVAAMLWHATAWDSGVIAMVFAFVGCAFLIGQPAVLDSAAGLILVVVVTFVCALVYQFAILPRVTDFPTLAAALAVLLLPAGLLLSMTSAGVLVCSFTFGFLALQNGYSADASTTLLSLGGAVSGLSIAAGAIYLCSYDRSRLIARRLLWAVRRDVVDIARARPLPDRGRFQRLTVDRLASFFDAAAKLPDDDPLRHVGIMADFRLGSNLIVLREFAEAAGEVALSDSVRKAVAAAYGPVLRASDRPVGLLRNLEAAVARVHSADGGLPTEALEALLGIRFSAAGTVR